MRVLMRDIPHLFLVALLFLVSCSSYEDMDVVLEEVSEEVLDDDSELGLTRGFSSFDFDLPLLDRFQSFVDEYGDTEVGVEIYMRGRSVNKEYTLSATMYSDRDSIFVTAVDAALLSELYHQEYFVNYMIVTGATRSSEEETYPDGAMVIGALLSASDPDDLYFISTFTKSSSVSGSGTEFDPYIIANLSDFETQIGDKLNSGESLSGKYYLQSDHLNFSGSSVGRVGASKSQYFAGHYDGGMMTISQLTLSSTSDVGLFYGIDTSGVFCNAIFENVTITGNSSSGEYCGVVAAHCKGGTIAHVFVESGCKVSAWKYAGGLFGSGYGNIYNSTCRGSISGYAAIGGLVGGMNNHDSDSIRFEDCVFGGTVVATDHCAGGIIGYANIIKDIYVIETYVSGTVYAEVKYTGGVIGQLNDFDYCDINYVYLGESCSTNYTTYTNNTAYESSLTLDNNSSTTSTSMWYVGGIIGYAKGNSTSSMICIYNTSLKGTSDIKAQHCIGGALGYAKDLIFCGGSFFNFVNITSNISSSSTSESYAGGAIGYCDNVFFKTIHFYNYGNITTTERYAGGIIGYCNMANSTTSYSSYFYNYGNVKCGSDNAGGCIGSLVNSTANSSNLRIGYNNYGSVSASNNVGGFVGVVSGDVSADNSNNYNGSSSSTYNVTVSGTAYVGGLYGKVHLNSNTPAELDIYGKSVADVTGTSEYVGGFIGGIYNDVSDLTSTISFKETGSSVIVSGGEYTGGLIGGANVQGTTLSSLTISSSLGNLSSSSKVSGGKYTGGIIGGMLNVTKCYISGCSNIATISGSDYVGGILGGVDTTDKIHITVSDSYNTGSVTGSGSGISGIVGFYRTYYNDIVVDKSCNTGNIKSTNGGDSHVGGMLGYVAQINSDDSGDVAVCQSYNSGSIDGYSHRGGLIGRTVSYANVNYCFNMGTVASGGSYVAGLVGSVREAGSDTKISILDCYNIGTTGYGILGGESGVNHKDCSFSHVYYLSTASNGDISLGSGYNAEGLDASSMASGSMSLWSKVYTTPSDMKTSGNLPYLTNAPYYSSYPKVTL